MVSIQAGPLLGASSGGDHMSGHQAAALAAFRRVPSANNLPSAASGDSLVNAGAEIAAIMQRTPAADPTLDTPPASVNAQQGQAQQQQQAQQDASLYGQHDQLLQAQVGSSPLPEMPEVLSKLACLWFWRSMIEGLTKGLASILQHVACE